jgi:hypothetical protein
MVAPHQEHFVTAAAGGLEWKGGSAGAGAERTGCGGAAGGAGETTTEGAVETGTEDTGETGAPWFTFAPQPEQKLEVSATLVPQ